MLNNQFFFPPIFPPFFLECKFRVQNYLPRTNNHLEGWHIQICLIMIIPQFGSKRDDAYNHMLLAQMAAAATPPQKLVCRRDVNTRLLTLVGLYQLPQTIPFLRGISYNLPVLRFFNKQLLQTKNYENEGGFQVRV